MTNGRQAEDEDRDAAERLILDHLPDVVTLTNRMFSQPSDAQDAAHEAVVAILRALPSFRGDGPVRHWLLKVALNAARDHRRKLGRKTRRETPLSDQEAARDMSGHPAEERERREALRAAIADLPDPLREPVILRYYHGLTQSEIGKLLGCSQKTIHTRLGKGLQRLNHLLGGSGAGMGQLLVAPVAGQAALDAVSAAQVATAKGWIGSHYAASASAAAAAGASTETAIGQSLAETGLNIGGVVVQAKTLAGAVIIATTFLIGGAVLSHQLFGSGAEREHAAEVADLRSQLEDERSKLLALQDDLAGQRTRRASRVTKLESELASLRGQLDEKEQALAALDDQAPGLTSGVRGAASDTDGDLGREERWAKLQETFSGVMDILQRMNEEGANQFALGPQLVAELGKVDTREFEGLVAFDRDSTDPAVLGWTRAVMLQAFIFVPATAPLKDDFMERYLQRTRSGSYGESFSAQALSRITFTMPPFVDAYDKIVKPLKGDLKGKFLDTALDRVAGTNSEAVRLDGTRYLAREPDRRATEELMRIFGRVDNSQAMRLVALKGLSNRADGDVLRLLQDAQGTETDEQVLARLGDAVTRVEKLVAKGQ